MNSVQTTITKGLVFSEFDLAFPSKAMADSFRIEQMVQVEGHLFIFSSVQPSKDAAGCTIDPMQGRVQRQIDYYPEDTVSKVQHVICGYDWRQGVPQDIIYIPNRGRFDDLLQMHPGRLQKLLATYPFQKRTLSSAMEEKTDGGNN